MMRKTVCALMLAATLAGTQAGAWDGSGITMSYWAQEGVDAAYESGAVSDGFDLGTDYTIPITRAQMARLTVDLASASSRPRWLIWQGSSASSWSRSRWYPQRIRRTRKTAQKRMARIPPIRAKRHLPIPCKRRPN